jgi:hypothetical protein
MTITAYNRLWACRKLQIAPLGETTSSGVSFPNRPLVRHRLTNNAVRNRGPETMIQPGGRGRGPHRFVPGAPARSRPLCLSERSRVRGEPGAGDLPRAAAELEVVGPVDAELCSGLVQGEPYSAVPFLHRVADESDLDSAEAGLERNGPADCIGNRGEQLAVPRVIGLEQVQDDQSGHGRIVRGGVMRAPPCLLPQPHGFEGRTSFA